MRQVPAGDQLPFRVPGKPAAARPDQLVDFVGADPVMLGVIEHREQNIEMVERVRESHVAGQAQVDVARVTPRRNGLVERDRDSLRLPAERLEYPPGQLRAATTRKCGDVQLKRERRVFEFGLRRAPAGHRGPEYPGHRGGQQAGRRVRPVVDVLAEAEALPAIRPAPAAYETDGIYLEQQRRRASLGSGLRVEHV